MPQWFVVNNNPCRHFVWKFSKSLYVSVRNVLLQKQSTILLQSHNLLLTIFGSKYGPKKNICQLLNMIKKCTSVKEVQTSIVSTRFSSQLRKKIRHGAMNLILAWISVWNNYICIYMYIHMNVSGCTYIKSISNVDVFLILVVPLHIPTNDQHMLQ